MKHRVKDLVFNILLYFIYLHAGRAKIMLKVLKFKNLKDVRVKIST